MTEKRYKLVNPNNLFKDMNIGIVENDTCMLKLIDVVELLNYLSNENELLKKQLKECLDARKAYKDDWKACVSYCDTYKDEIDTYKDNVEGLKEENEQLRKENKHLRCTIESNSQDDYIDFLEKQNEILKERIEELASNDKIVFMVNE